MFISTKGGKRRVIRKDFKDDYVSARSLYIKAIEAEKPYATLACVNMGFPPPEELRAYTVTKRGRDKQTRKIRTVTVEINPLKELNMQGKLWCPYCMELRPFRLRKNMTLNGIRVNEARYICPICGVSSNDFNVNFWNPTASIHMTASLSSMKRTRRSSTDTKPTRRRRRR